MEGKGERERRQRESVFRESVFIEVARGLSRVVLMP